MASSTPIYQFKDGHYSESGYTQHEGMTFDEVLAELGMELSPHASYGSKKFGHVDVYPRSSAQDRAPLYLVSTQIGEIYGLVVIYDFPSLLLHLRDALPLARENRLQFKFEGQYPDEQYSD